MLPRFGHRVIMEGAVETENLRLGARLIFSGVTVEVVDLSEVSLEARAEI